jgi:hypothetical protein
MVPLMLLGLMLILMLMRVFLPIGQKVQGRQIKEVRLSLRERLLVQRFNIYAIGAVLLLGALGQWVSPLLEVMVILLAFAIVMIPVKYILTNEGVALNNALFRRWDEFGDFHLRGVRVQLVGRGTLGGFTLYVPSREQSDVLKVLKREVSKKPSPE